jgi:hypothetical protein
MRKVIAALILEAVVLALLSIVAIDVVAHRRVERLGGVNLWGYRGAVLRQKQPNEIRIAVVGGDLAFGWGVAASETLATSLKQLVLLAVDRPGHPLRTVTAVDLGATGLSTSAYGDWIARYSYLKPDYICIVADAAGFVVHGRWELPDRASRVFRATGYSPMLPVVLQEKGDVAHSAVLRAAGRAAAALDRATVGSGRSTPADYPAGVVSAVGVALSVAKGVVVVLPPYHGDEVAAHDAVRAMVLARFANDRRVRLVDAGDEPAMYDDDVTLDGYHFSAGGHEALARVVTPMLLELIAVS